MAEQNLCLDHRHGGEIFDIPETERNQILDFSININPLGLSPRGRKAVLENFDVDAGRYPDSGCVALRKALGQRYQLPADRLVCGNGATELMYALIRAIRPSMVYVPAPSFSEYRFAAEAEHIPVRSFVLDRNNGFLLTDLSFLEEMPYRAVLFLGNPNNPDGQPLPESVFSQCLVVIEKKDGWLVIDESFIDFLGDEGSFRSFVLSHPRVIVLLSLTKFYAVPGLRIGAAAADTAVIQVLTSVLHPWNVNGCAQRYLTEAIKDASYISASREYVREERRRMLQYLEKIPGIHVYDSAVNFFLLQLTNSMTGKTLAEKMLTRRVHIRRCNNYERLDDTFFRIAVRKKDENDIVLTALDEVMKE